MGDFFHGWKRKIGLLMLVMALVFMVGWIRAVFVEDYLTLGTNHGHQYQTIGSYRGGIIWKLNSSDSLMTAQAVWVRSPLNFVGSSDPLKGEGEGSYKVSWRWQWSGFDFGEAIKLGTLRIKWFRFPYWSLVIPLTLLSAYLLLSKPRKSIQKKIDEPIPVEEA